MLSSVFVVSMTSAFPFGSSGDVDESPDGFVVSESGEVVSVVLVSPVVPSASIVVVLVSAGSVVVPVSSIVLSP